MKTHRDQINEILVKYQKKYAEYEKDYAFLAEIFRECLIELDECINAEN